MSHSLIEWVSDKVTYCAVCGQLKDVKMIQKWRNNLREKTVEPFSTGPGSKRVTHLKRVAPGVKKKSCKMKKIINTFHYNKVFVAAIFPPLIRRKCFSDDSPFFVPYVKTRMPVPYVKQVWSPLPLYCRALQSFGIFTLTYFEGWKFYTQKCTICDQYIRTIK